VSRHISYVIYGYKVLNLQVVKVCFWISSPLHLNITNDHHLIVFIHFHKAIISLAMVFLIMHFRGCEKGFFSIPFLHPISTGISCPVIARDPRILLVKNIFTKKLAFL